MKAMKILFGIFMPLFICLIIAFGISVAVFGRDDISTAEGVVLTGDEKTIELSESYNDISIESGAYDITIKKSESPNTTIKYFCNEGREITARVDNDKLIIENKDIDLFDIFHFGMFGDYNAYMVITIPDKIYNDVNFSFNAGTVKVENIVSEKLKMYVGAGEVDITAYAKEIKVDVGAGSAKLTNATGDVCENLDVDVSAGELKVNGFETNEFDIDVSAGSADLVGLTGTGKVDVSAGGAYLTMERLNGDIDASASAGQIDIRLPEDSSVRIETEVSAGDVKTDLGGKTEHPEDGTTRTFGTGEHTIIADVSAGNINIMKK